MNCNSLQQLIEEVPLTRWSEEQRYSAWEHSSSCDECRLLLSQQEALFAEFDRMVVPEASRAFEIQPQNELHGSDSIFGSRQGLLSGIAVLLLCFGSVYQLFSESGLSLYWLADGSRLESAIAIIIGSPVLSIALILIGLVYCLGLQRNHGVQE